MNRLSPRRRIFLLCLVFGCLASAALLAQPAAKLPKKLVAIEGITEYRLDNGVRFLLFPDPSSSTVTVNMTVFVGSRHEGYGETGMAHLLEHMLFKGSKEFPEPDKALQAHGAAEANGTTWVDRTNYYETMPATDKNLEFGIRLEADRLVHCFIRREDLAKEMTVVRNEFEIGENDPPTILNQRMMAVAFEWHNYGKSTMGNRADIERVPIERLHAFYKKYYQPDNILLVVAGKFDEPKALNLISKHFGAILRPKRTLDQTYTEEPPQDGERTVTLRRVGKVAVVGTMYHIPAAAHADFAAVEVLEDLLTHAPSGRLYKALVETKKATRVSGAATAWHDPGILEFTVRVNEDVKPEEVRDILLDQLEKPANTPVTKEEVDKAKQRLKASRERALTKSKEIAIELSEWAGAGDWRLLFLHRDRVAKVRAEDVNRVAVKYMVHTNRTLGMFLPTAQAARTQIPETPSVAELVKDYKGGKGLTLGEAFDPTPENLEKRTKRDQLLGGLKVALLPKKTRGESVVGQLTLHFGNAQSLLNQDVACNLVGGLMMRGTKKHTRQEIQDLLDKLEARLHGSSVLGQLTFSWQAKRNTLPAVLDLLREILHEPSFPDKELDVLVRSEKQGLQKATTDPYLLALKTLMRKLNPYAKDDVRYVPSFEESLERVEKLARADIVRLYHEQIGAAAAELALVGDFDSAAISKQIETLVADWQAKVPYERIQRRAFPQVAASRETINTPDKESATYVAGLTFAMKDTDPDYAALLMANYLLGGSSTSRLFDKLRQKEGLSYSVGTHLGTSARDPYTLFMIYAECNPLVIDKTDKQAVAEVGEAVKKGFSDRELADGIKGYLQELKVQFAEDSVVGATLQEGLELGRTFQYYADLEKKVANLKLADVNQAMSRHLAAERLVIVRAGDFSKKGSEKNTPDKK